MPGGEINSTRSSCENDFQKEITDVDFRKEILQRIDTLTEEMKNVSSAVSKIANYLTNNSSRKEKITFENPNTDTTNKLSSESWDNKTPHVRNEQSNRDEDVIITGISSPKQKTVNHVDSASKIKQDIINTWNMKLKNRRENFWQMLRNSNTAKTYETWMNNSPVIIPKKVQLKEITGEPLNQTQRREKQCMDNYRAEKDLLELRAESHEAKYKTIDKEMHELLVKKASGRTRDILQKWWKEECSREEIISLKRWERQNSKFIANYEKNFINFYRNRNPFLKSDDFETPQIENHRKQNENGPTTDTHGPTRQSSGRENSSYQNRSRSEDISYAKVASSPIRPRKQMSEPSQAEKKSTEIPSSSIQTTQLHDQTKTTADANGNFLSQRRRKGKRR